MKLHSIWVASALALGAVGAQAGTFDWGDHGTLEVGTNMVSGSFTDYWQFTIDPEHLVSSTAVANNLGGGSVLHITDGAYSLWSMGADDKIGGGDDSMLSSGSWSFDGTSGDATHSVLLSPGSYYYMVTGKGDGAFTGMGLYSLTSTIAPVPETETWAMMLAGLGMLGFLAARRRRDD